MTGTTLYTVSRILSGWEQKDLVKRAGTGHHYVSTRPGIPCRRPSRYFWWGRPFKAFRPGLIRFYFPPFRLPVENPSFL